MGTKQTEETTMNTLQILTTEAAKRSDQLLADSIRLIDATLASIDAGSDEARAQRMVRAAMYQALESRHPHVDAALEAWASLDYGVDTRTYSEVLLEALGI
jgi:hypothetical protein